MLERGQITQTALLITCQMHHVCIITVDIGTDVYCSAAIVQCRAWQRVTAQCLLYTHYAEALQPDVSQVLLLHLYSEGTKPMLGANGKAQLPYQTGYRMPKTG